MIAGWGGYFVERVADEVGIATAGLRGCVARLAGVIEVSDALGNGLAFLTIARAVIRIIIIGHGSDSFRLEVIRELHLLALRHSWFVVPKGSVKSRKGSEKAAESQGKAVKRQGKVKERQRKGMEGQGKAVTYLHSGIR